LKDAGKWLIGSARSGSDLKSDSESDNELNNASELTTIDEEEGEGRMGESKVGYKSGRCVSPVGESSSRGLEIQGQPPT
jgi:hypothetical protein